MPSRSVEERTGIREVLPTRWELVLVVGSLLLLVITGICALVSVNGDTLVSG